MSKVISERQITSLPGRLAYLRRGKQGYFKTQFPLTLSTMWEMANKIKTSPNYAVSHHCDLHSVGDLVLSFTKMALWLLRLEMLRQQNHQAPGISKTVFLEGGLLSKYWACPQYCVKWGNIQPSRIRDGDFQERKKRSTVLTSQVREIKCVDKQQAK